MLGAVGLAADHDPRVAVLAFEAREMAGENRRRHDRPALPIRHQVAPVRASGRLGGRGDDLEILGAVSVGENDELIVPVADVVAQAMLTRSDQHGRSVGMRGVDQPDFVGLPAPGGDRHETMAAQGIERDRERLILLLVDQHVGRRVVADPMAIDQELAMVCGVAHVEQGAAVRGPRKARCAGNDVRQVAAARDVANAQRVLFGAAFIDLVGVEPVVGAVLDSCPAKNNAFRPRAPLHRAATPPARRRQACA